ncbi:dihydrofolate reductase family protein [Streptomyces violaceorubidus]
MQNFTVSSDGVAAGEDQSLERPSVTPSTRGGSWPGPAPAPASWPNRTEPGGSRGLDDYFTRDFSHNIGAEIMGRNKFGPQRGPWQAHDWRGWWGDEPPFHTPVFVLTHHTRPSFTLSDTTFHFVDGDPATGSRGPGGRTGQGRPARRGRVHRPGVPRRRPSTPCTWSSRR